MRAAITRSSLPALLAGLALAACGGGNGEEEAQRTPGCKEAAAPAPRRADVAPPPRQSVRPGEQLTAVVRTSCGTFEVALDTRRAPKTTNSFVYLARRGFYDGLAFHRIASGFVIQAGDPLGNGRGGPGYSIDEQPPANLAYTKGVVAMAKSPIEPPGRSGSQFFVVLAADAGLSPDFALLGRVDRGLDAVERIGRLGTPAERPAQTVLIEGITIERG
jgi:peptidyl-prolyl cis-trans isomerase B (cyclophilin B)